MRTGVNISVDKDTVREVGRLILAIIDADCDEATKQVALTTVKEGIRIENVHVQGCTFQG